MVSRHALGQTQPKSPQNTFEKGKPVYVEGRLKVDEWTDRDGNSRYTLDVTATDMQFIGSGSDRDGGYSNDGPDMDMPAESPSSSAAAAGSAAADDDIPF